MRKIRAAKFSISCRRADKMGSVPPEFFARPHEYGAYFHTKYSIYSAGRCFRYRKPLITKKTSPSGRHGGRGRVPPPPEPRRRVFAIAAPFWLGNMTKRRCNRQRCDRAREKPCYPRGRQGLTKLQTNKTVSDE